MSNKRAEYAAASSAYQTARHGGAASANSSASYTASSSATQSSSGGSVVFVKARTAEQVEYDRLLRERRNKHPLPAERRALARNARLNGQQGSHAGPSTSRANHGGPSTAPPVPVIRKIAHAIAPPRKQLKVLPMEKQIQLQEEARERKRQEGPKWWKCHVCQIPITLGFDPVKGLSTKAIHLKGKQHMTNLAKKRKDYLTWCEICNVKIHSLADLHKHNNGAKHQGNVRHLDANARFA